MRRRNGIPVVLAAVLTLALSAAITLAPSSAVTPAAGAPDFVFPLQANSVRLAVIGDFGTGELPQIEVARQMVKARAVFPFEFVITVGDNLYTGSQPADFDKDFAIPYKALLDAGILFYATLGNHDATNERFYKPFNMNGANYYAFKKRNVHFFALDSNYMDRAQTSWIEAQLRSAGDADWKICFFHHPLYSSGRYHGSDTDLRKVLEPLFVKYGVDVVLSGHDHVYERVVPQRGIYYFTEGSSGELRAGNLASSPLTAKGFDTDRTFMTIEIAGEDLYFLTTSRSGVAVDSGVIRKMIRPVPGTVPRD
jgi:predicted phosphodiesterase